jgi:hypothetical protein
LLIYRYKLQWVLKIDLKQCRIKYRLNRYRKNSIKGIEPGYLNANL